MKRLLLVIIAVFASCSFAALEPVLVGDFENGKTGDDNRYDNWWELGTDTVFVDDTTKGVTRGTHSLKISIPAGVWGWGGATATKDYGGTTQEEKWATALAVVAEKSVIAVDVTAFDADVPGSSGESQIGLFHSTSNGESSWDYQLWQFLITDGVPHTYYFEVHDAMKEAFQASIDADGWGANFGFGFNTVEGSAATVYIDNVWIYPEGPISEYAAYDPSVEQVFNADPMYVDVTFHWMAGNDPNDSTYPILPDIVDQYVFLTSGNLEDPNIYYIGKTGEDPGLTDPASQFGPITIPSNTKYQWIVAEAIDGFEQTLIENVSTIDDLAEGNIRSTTWDFNALSLAPEIITQPVSARFPIGGPNPTFTIEVSSASTPHYQWYYSLDSVIDEGDTQIGSGSGGNTDTLTIGLYHKAYQAYFYCRVSNASTISDGGTDPDLYSDIVGCVIERKVAEYLFEGNLNDSSGEGNNGTGVNGAAAVSGDSIEGSSALVLNGVDQYVQIEGYTIYGEDDESTEDDVYVGGGYPNAGLDAVGGIGGGLDVGSVTCWVKLNSAPVTQGAILANTNTGWPVTQFQLAIESDDPATYTNLQSYEWGDQEGLVYWQSWRPTYDGDKFNMAGDDQWHMLAVTWDMNGSIYSYVDGSLVASGSCTPNEFSLWTNDTIIGAFETGNYFDGKIDALRVYNYQITPEDIGQEYFDMTGNPACMGSFDGDIFNVVNSGSSYCRIDIMDFAAFAANWLNDGFYPAQ